MFGLVDCTSDDLAAENVTLRSELSQLKSHMVRLMQEHGPSELLAMIETNPSLESDLKGLRAEVEKLKAENSMLERFNHDQSNIGKQLSIENVQLKQTCQSLKVDLLRVMPLQVEREKYRKQSEEQSVTLRMLTDENNSLRAELESLQRNLESCVRKGADTEASLVTIQIELEAQTAKVGVLQLEVEHLGLQLVTEKELRGKSDQSLTNLSSELAAQHQKAKSQGKEIERQIAQLENCRQEILVLKNRLHLRDEALLEHVSLVPDPPILVISPKPRQRKLPPTKPLPLLDNHCDEKSQAPPTGKAKRDSLQDPSTPIAKCTVDLDDMAAFEMPSCMPIYPFSSAFSKASRKAD